MYVTGIGTAAPPGRYSKAECWEAFQRSPWYRRLDDRAVLLVRALLMRDNGIDGRRLAVARLSEVFDIDADVLRRRFEQAAPALATQAAQRALHTAGLRPAEIDAVVVSTCTGYLCPGLSGYVSERLGLRPAAQGFDLVGQGCGGALPNMRLGQALVSSGQCPHVLSVCVEVSSAAIYLDNDPGVLVSACLFGDGAGAAVLSAQPRSQRLIAWRDSESLLDPATREALRFEQRGGLLRNILTRAVPSLAAGYVRQVLDRVMERTGLSKRRISAWILHAGGRDVLELLEQRLELQSMDLRYSAATLREYGNLSSAFVYFVLQAALADSAPGGWWWLSSFGAGFSCHGALLEVA
jgi:predicted naringenin-chalcone synthase